MPPMCLLSPAKRSLITSSTLRKMVAEIFWAEEQRTSELDISQKVYEIAAKRDTVKGSYVPDLILYHKFDGPTSEIRDLLDAPELKKGSRCSTSSYSSGCSPLRNSKAKTFSTCGSNASYVRGPLYHRGHPLKSESCALQVILICQLGIYHGDVSPPNLT
jgi:hypothetical protein